MRVSAISLTVCVAFFAGCAAPVIKSSPDAQPLGVPAESAKHIVLNITGSKVATESKDWDGFKGLWNEAMKKEAAGAGRRLTIQEGNTKPASEPGTLVVVYINDYRWVSAGARFAVGIMTGNAYVDSKVSFVDLQSGKKFGDRSYNTSSSAGEGIFSAMTDTQVAAICKEIVAEIQPR